MKENDINSQIETSSNLLAQLEAELADIPNRRAVAISNADSAALISLSHRSDDLPVTIQMTKVRLEQLHLQSDEIKLVELKADAEKLAVTLMPLRERRDKAIEEFKFASFVHQDAQQNYRDKQLAISERRRQIETLSRETTAPTPIRQSLMANGSR